MKKVLMSFLLAAGIYGLVSGQSTQTPSSQSQPGTSSSTSMQSDKDSWQKIGEKTLDLSKDREILDCSADLDASVAANQKFSAIKFKAKDGTVNLTDVELEYEGGTKQKVTFDTPIRAESESKVVALNNKDQKLDKINFNFKKPTGQASAGQSTKVKVELWGMKEKSSSSGMGSSPSSRPIDTSMYRQPATKPANDWEKPAAPGTYSNPGSSTNPAITPSTPGSSSTSPGNSETTR
jgi:hypothetical protein